MKTRNLLLLAATLAAFTPSATNAATPPPVWETAKPGPQPPGAPRASDVIMRALKLRQRSAKESYDVRQALNDFHVTRLEWAYITDAKFIGEQKQAGRVFGGAVSAPSYVRPAGVKDWFERVVVVNRLGQPLIAPSKRNWSRTLWGCMNNPELERGYVADLKKSIDSGAQVMQRDEPEGNYLAVKWGGCFCEHCMAAFRKFLAKKLTADERRKLGVEPVDHFDYRAYLAKLNAPVGDEFGRWDGGRLKQLFEQFQLDSTVAFHQRTRAALDRLAGRHVAMSCNNGVAKWSPVQLEFDWAFGELSFSHAQPDYLLSAFHAALEHGRLQVVTMPKSSHTGDLEPPRSRTRPTVATAYALGGWCMVPWDVYMPGDTPRYFGEPEQYADLFGFIRAAAPWLDGYSEAAVTGVTGRDTRYEDRPPVTVLDHPEVLAVVRAKPGQSDAPVVIHLVDWSSQPRPFKIALDPTTLSGGHPWRVSLLQPTAYNAEAHRTAQTSGKFASLIQKQELGHGYLTTASIPALHPWGIVVLERDNAVSSTSIWPPTILAAGGEFVEEQTVRLACATPGASIRYTLDGSVPTSHSPVYREPLRIREDRTLQAAAFLGGKSSSPVEAKFRRDRSVQAVKLVNPDFEQQLKGWQIAQSKSAKMTVTTSANPALKTGASVQMQIRQSDGVPYHLRFSQVFPTEPATEYSLHFTAAADKPTRIRVGLQEAVAPFRTVGIRMLDIGPQPSRYVVTGVNQHGHMTCRIQFDVGTAETGRTVWIDEVRLSQRTPH